MQIMFCYIILFNILSLSENNTYNCVYIVQYIWCKWSSLDITALNVAVSDKYGPVMKELRHKQPV